MTRKAIVNESELEWQRSSHDPGFEVWRKALGREAGSRRLGCSLYRLPAGKKAWPRHAHLANEEAIYILSGTGRSQIGKETHLVGPGDFLALIADPDAAHQLKNTGNEDLIYLCFSTMMAPDVIRYPDSGKTGVLAGSAPGGDPSKRVLTAFFPDGSEVPYWTGE